MLDGWEVHSYTIISSLHLQAKPRSHIYYKGQATTSILLECSQVGLDIAHLSFKRESPFHTWTQVTGDNTPEIGWNFLWAPPRLFNHHDKLKLLISNGTNLHPYV